MNKFPHRPIIGFDAAFRQKFSLKAAKGEIRPVRHPRQEPIAVRRQHFRAVAMHWTGRQAAGRPEKLRPFHDARSAHFQNKSDRPDGLTRLDAIDRSLAQIL
jgi:hypothetical protein